MSPMLRMAREILKRLGGLSALLIALVVIMPAMEAQACTPTASAAAGQTAITASTQTDPCADGCQDCGLACSHGCCHAPNLGAVGDATPPPSVVSLSRDLWANNTSVPLYLPSGPERPPRA